MKHLKTIDPLKALKGKLNFLKNEKQPVMQILRLANNLTSKSESSQLSKISLEDIAKLKTNTSLQSWEHKKMLFELHVHRTVNPGANIGTIYEQLDKHQKRIIKTILNYTDNLNSRQLLFLNYVIRQKIQAIYPNWQNLHLNPDSPSRRELQIMPTISSQKDIFEIKTMPKKKVIAAITKIQEAQNPKQES